MTRLLVVEDDPVQLSLYLEALAARGFQVESAGTLAGGLALLARSRFDLVLTDLELPDGLGLEVVRAACLTKPPTPVLIASGQGSEEDIESGVAAGARDYLIKPFPMSLLFSKIERSLGRREVSGAQHLLPGGDQEAFGRFQLREVLGQGGQGKVYLALDAKTGERVALKVRLSGPDESPESAARRRFLREAYSLSATDHPALVRIVAHGSSRGADFIAMELVQGPTLKKRVDASGPLSPAEVQALLLRLGEGLEVLHAAHLVHRDLKPQNIILRDGDPAAAVLVDFGLAKLRYDRSLTLPTERHGTPRFMSPEQIHGEELSGSSDLFSLGLVGCYAASGREPFDDLQGPQLLLALSTRPSRIPDLFPALREVLKGLIAVDPARRTASASELCAALRELSLP